MIYNVSHSGENGAVGATGVSIVNAIPEYRLSDSSSSITGSGAGYAWSETKPEIPEGKYLWTRQRNELSDGSTKYSNATCDITMSGVVLDVSQNKKAIAQKVWQSDISTSINQYDNSTGQSIRDRVTATETDLSGIHTTISDIQSEVNTKADGSTVTSLTSRVQTVESTAGEHTRQISALDTRLSDDEDTLSSTSTTASQTAEKFTWLVKSGTSASNFTLTDRVATLVTNAMVIKDPAGSQTVISGGKINANSITTAMLATDAIKSSNYEASANANSPYSAVGTFLDLTTGTLYMPNFGVNGTTGAAYFNGQVNAASGKIGDEGNSYWEIGTVYDSAWGDYAGLISHGNALIRTGKLTLSDERLSSQNGGAYIHESDGWYDYGLNVPDRAATGQAKYLKDNFLYIRKLTTAPSDGTLESDWQYLFKVDKDGTVYENGTKLSDKYALKTDVGSTYLPTAGGTVTGNLTVSGTTTLNGTVSTTLQIRTNLASTSAATFTGAQNAVVAPGVTGTLGVGNGGTGKASWTQYGIVYASATNALSQLANGTSGQVLTSKGNAIPAWTNQSALSVGAATKATQDADGNVISTTYRKLDNGDFDTITVTELTAGNLVVTGAARFTNEVYGDLTGTASNAAKVANNLKIQLNGGTTEGTNQFTYNGSAAKNINITKSSVGLGNVENTALSTWAGSANLTTTKVGTLAGAATKSVDTSITSGSTSTNLPTSAAVADFVEGKGYVTSSGVTSARVQATSPVVSSQNTAQSTTLNTTISLADGYGDTKNPYAEKNANVVLAGPASGNAAAPAFRALVAADIPTLAASKVGLGNVTNNKQVKGLSSGTTSGHLVSWGADGYTVADSGLTKSGIVSSISVNNDQLTISLADGTSTTQTINITGQVVSGATILSDSSGNGISLGSASKPVYFSNGVPAAANTIPSITLNGTATTSPNFYAPTGAGTNGYYLKSNGSGAPTWAAFSKSTVGLGNVDNTADANKNVLTATKFSSARTIALTGDVTGSTSADGSSGWSIAATVKDDSHEHTMATVRKPIESKTFAGIIGTATTQVGGNFYFAAVHPDSYYDMWSITYRITATIAGVSEGNGNGYAESIVYISGMRNTYAAYKTWNNISNTSYRPYYYHALYIAKQAGITGGYGHALGVALRYSYNPTTAANTRTINVEILDAQGCTVDFLDSAVKSADLPGIGSTNYDTIAEFDGLTNGNTMSGDRNDVNYQNRVYYTSSKAAEQIYRYQILLRTMDGDLVPVSSANNTFTIGKTYSTHKFDPFGEIYYYTSTSSIAPNGNVGNSVLYRHYLADLRYAFDLDASANYQLVAREPVYLTAIPQADGGAVLTILDGHIMPLTQTLPTEEDGVIYIHLGQAYEDTHPYRVELLINHSVYWYKDGAVRNYAPTTTGTLDSIRLVSSTTASLNDVAEPLKVKFYHGSGGNGITDIPSGDGTQFGMMTYASALGYVTQELSSWYSNSNWGKWIRINHSGTWTDWAKVVTSVNYNDYAPSKTGTGASGTWGISISGNAATATSADKATKDGSGNTITSHYVTLSTAQTISGAKTFSAATSFTNTTASTSKTTGAVKVSGGVGVVGRMSANEVEVNNGCVLQFNSTTESLDFVFN